MSMRWEMLLSCDRLGMKERRPSTATRSDFQVDFDRIVFSGALRRLQDKTQVFPLAQGAHVRTRLTHSLEVSSVGRSLGSMVGEVLVQRHGLQPLLCAQDIGNLVAAACLAHDIGNPPFGHAGEEAMRSWFAESACGREALSELSTQQQLDLLRFEGNAQGFRQLTRLQNERNEGGMRLSCATLATFSKYPCAVNASCRHGKFGFFVDDVRGFESVARTVGLLPQGQSDWCRHPLAFLVEAADDICYHIIDIEDACRIGLLSSEQGCELLLALLASYGGNTGQLRSRMDDILSEQGRIEFLRAKAIGCCIEDAVATFLDHEAALLDGQRIAPLTQDMKTGTALDACRDLAEAYIYRSVPVAEVGIAGLEVLRGLLDALVGAVQDVAQRGEQASARSQLLICMLPERIDYSDPYRRLLAVTDFISAMTDTQALTLYRKLTGITLPR